MKILNPTVFLKDGELYCLTVEVPKEPTNICKQCEGKGWITGIERPCGSCNPGGEWRSSKTAVQKYFNALHEAKSSAVKVKDWNHIEPLITELVYTTDKDLYTLTGYEAEVTEQDTVEDGGGCYVAGSETFATISPIKQEESQEDEFELQFGNAMKCRLKIVNGNLEVVAGVDGWGNALTKDDFITRNERSNQPYKSWDQMVSILSPQAQWRVDNILERADEAAELYASQFREEPQKPDFTDLAAEALTEVHFNEGKDMNKAIDQVQEMLETFWNTYVVKQPTGSESELRKEMEEYRERYNCNQYTVVNQKAEIAELKAANAELVEALKLTFQYATEGLTIDGQERISALITKNQI